MTTWSTTDKSANITLSNGNLTAASTSVSAGAVRSSTSKSTGNKIYFETVWNTAPSGANTACGITTGSAGLGSIASSSIGAIIYPTGAISVNGAASGISLGAVTVGTTICFAVDLANSRFWVRLNSGLWNNTPGAEPATNT